MTAAGAASGETCVADWKDTVGSSDRSLYFLFFQVSHRSDFGFKASAFSCIVTWSVDGDV